jgi:multidrug efflux system outer membrane protein
MPENLLWPLLWRGIDMNVKNFFNAEGKIKMQRRREKSSARETIPTPMNASGLITFFDFTRKRIVSPSASPRLCVKNAVMAGAIMLCLSGCTMAPNYTRPDAPVSASWPSGEAYQAEAAKPDQKPVSEVPWRQYFIEPRLQKVIEQALANNRDLRVAVLSIEKSRAQYRIQRADLLPTVSGTAGATIQRTPADLSSSGQARISEQYNVGLGVSSYELDLFGRVQSLKDQALEQYLATEQTRNSVQISLVAETANAWLTMAADRERLQLARQTLSSQEEYYQIIKHRYTAGITSALDLYQAQTAVEAARVDIARYTTLLAQDQNALTLLVGKPLSADLLPTELGAVIALQELPIGISSDVLLRRPDILAAEHTLKGANANIGAARAAFFPRIGLSASFGTASAKLTDLFQPGSVAWNFVPQISVPLFDTGRNIAGLDVSKADRDIAVARYEKAIQTAFREVADALAQRGTINNQLAAQQSLTDATDESHKLSQARYDKGVDSYLSVIVAQRALYAAQQNLITVRLAKLANQATTYKVLGGGLAN